jgi:hypothetical protein
MKEKIKNKKITQKITIDDLAIMIKNSFDVVYQKLDSHDQKFDEIKDDVETIKDQLMTTNDRIDFLAESRVSNERFSILQNRVTLLEEYSK